MEIKFESYILKDKDIIINYLVDEGDENFINIEEVALIDKRKLDYDYISGAMCIHLRGERILGLREWDLIDQLWLYFTEALMGVYSESRASFSFPDQPFKVVLEMVNKSYLRITLHEKSYKVELKRFVSEFIPAGEVFYNNLSLIFPEQRRDIEYQLGLLNKLKNV